jgi:hypothetical protein
METMYFIFGVLSVIALIAIGVVIYSVVKIFKLKKQIVDLQKDIHWNFNDLSDRFRDTYQKIEDCYVNARDMSNVYTDSRIDKLEDKLTGQLGAKQLIKG